MHIVRSTADDLPDVEALLRDAVGRLSTDLLRTLSLPPDAEAYVCGPTSFMTAVSLALTACGLDATRIHSETFGAGAALTNAGGSGLVRSSLASF